MRFGNLEGGLNLNGRTRLPLCRANGGVRVPFAERGVTAVAKTNFRCVVLSNVERRCVIVLRCEESWLRVSGSRLGMGRAGGEREEHEDHGQCGTR